MDMHVILLRDRTEGGDIKRNLARPLPVLTGKVSLVFALSVLQLSCGTGLKNGREAVPHPPRHIIKVQMVWWGEEDLRG